MIVSIKEIISLYRGDSKKLASEAKANLLIICRNHIDKLKTLYKKYDYYPFGFFEDYSSNGSLDIENIEFNEEIESILLRYEETWPKGGYRNSSHYLPIIDLISFDYHKLEIELKEKRIKHLDTQIEYRQNELNKLIQEKLNINEI